MLSPPSIRAVTVYCSAREHVDRAYFETATQLGGAIARKGWNLVYGGNDLGPMGALANAARASGGKVIGITPRLFVDQGVADHQCDELIVTDTMRQRKELVEQRGDAFIALPGGLGTLEEFFEILVGRMLGFHDKPIVLLNERDFYAPLLSMLENSIERRFVKPSARQSFHVVESVELAIERIENEFASPSPRDVSAQAD
jgi:uncharacterized protein (TIGR00730 family)